MTLSHVVVLLLLLSPLSVRADARPPAGINFADALWRVFDDPVGGLPSTRAAARAACTDYGLTSVRFGASPYYPDTFVASWAAGGANRTAYWQTVDGVMQAFADGGCAHLVPSLLFNSFMIADAAKEPLGALAAGARGAANSTSWAWAVAYVTEFVSRYGTWTSGAAAASSPLVVAWELTNEFNLLADLDQSQFCNSCNPPRGTPSRRTLADNVSTDDWVAISTGLADAIRAADPIPGGRPVSGGTALARPSAEHLRASYTLPERDWTNDTFAQFVDNFADIHACCEWASVHLYADDGGRWGAPPQGAANASDLILFAQQAAAQVSAKRGSPLLLYLGEYGELPGPGGPAAPRPFVGAVLDVLASTAPGSPGPPPPPGVSGQTALATIWVWEYPGQNLSYSLYPNVTEGVNQQLVAYNKGG